MKVLSSVHYFIVLIILVFTISACTTNEQNSEALDPKTPSSTPTGQLSEVEDKHDSELEVEEEIEPSPAVEKPKEATPVVDLSKLPQSKDLEFLLEGMTEKVPATLTLSDQGYGFYLMDGFNFAMEEPGKDIVFSKMLPDYFARVELLPADTNIEDVKAYMKEQLLYVGDVVEMEVNEIIKLVGDKASFSLYSNNAELSRHDIVLEDQGVYFLVSLYLPNGEAMEGISQRFYPMIQTLIAAK